MSSLTSGYFLPGTLAPGRADSHFGSPRKRSDRVKPDNSGCLLAVTTLPSAEAASKLTRALVERRLIACGTMLSGATSIYRWKGAVEEAAEVVVLMKTTVDRWEQLKRELPGLHPYESPELLAVPVTDGLASYIAWLKTETGHGSVETA